MIAEATQIPFLGSINELVLRERHEIEVLDALIVVLDRASTKVCFIDDFSDVFEDEVMGFQVSIRP